MKDYDCDISRMMAGAAMKKEVADIGYGYKANCWCTHGCWIMSSIVFNPRKMLSKVFRGYREIKKLNAPLDLDETRLRAMEEKYGVDRNKLTGIGLV